MVVDGRRPLLGEGVPRGDVGDVLADAPCDVAVLVARGRTVTIDAEHPVLVPFGGAEHDWAALEAGAWLAASRGASLTLVGLASRGDDDRDASRLLADASLVVQQMAGVSAMPELVEASARAMIDATTGAGIVLIGLPAEWREDGPRRESRRCCCATSPHPSSSSGAGCTPALSRAREGATAFSWSSLGMTGMTGMPDFVPRDEPRSPQED